MTVDVWGWVFSDDDGDKRTSGDGYIAMFYSGLSCWAITPIL